MNNRDIERLVNAVATGKPASRPSLQAGNKEEAYGKVRS